MQIKTINFNVLFTEKYFSFHRKRSLTIEEKYNLILEIFLSFSFLLLLQH